MARFVLELQFQFVQPDGAVLRLGSQKSRPFDLILKHHQGMTHPVAPRWIEKKEAPVKQVVQRSEDVNLGMPRKEYMDRARTLWDELGLPKLQPREPWFGYELGYWSEK